MFTWKDPINKVCIIALSISLYLFFDDRQFWFFQASSEFANDSNKPRDTEAELSVVGVDIQSELNGKDSVKLREIADHQTNLRRYGRCQPPLGGSIKYRIENGIYTWVDSKGITNYSDQKPKHHAALYQPKNSRVLDYFELRIKGKTVTHSFKNALITRLNAIFRSYTSVIGLQAMRKVTLNIEVLPNRREYERVVKSYGGDGTNTTGIYFGNKNTALVVQRSYEQTMQTAVHEAVHAINQAVIGYSPRWLNEGLAEYFETVEVKMHHAKIKPQYFLNKQGHIGGKVVAPLELLNAEHLWSTENAEPFYKSSWAFVHFLMSSNSGRQTLKDILLQEQSEPCSSLTANQLKGIMTNNQPNLAAAFQKYLNLPIKTQRL
ncbi:DUF1570 domain-containing protein [Pseudoalteromonas luteoviolacea]|uniref:DUF1570 domain-containing protein n=1 Tax=Pseudoalteromonas luteoviolacea (strain 2ta16) TaxID=1353533 RepID=V4HXP0_PSEL2|nr:DUF1570 domain-containing protein [Pseudoalteromonas luteoviolacea]ESP94558.1 protein of unknown function (DUF1570) [Pseudoalteromonas luteoviolacea 2ta16]KZN32252.1 hypothetical protein N483_03640 [Pseudoalteromonas luteoviolacea NCIMB 1944]